MDKIVGTWNNVELRQTISYFEDGTFSIQHEYGINTISGHYAFRDGIYYMKTGAGMAGVTAFKIISYSDSSMRVGMNTGEVYTCHRISKTPKLPQQEPDPMAQFVQGMDQYTAHLEQQNKQMLDALNQQTAAMIQQAALYTERVNQENKQALDAYNQQCAANDQYFAQMLQNMNQQTAAADQQINQVLQQMNGSASPSPFPSYNSSSGGNNNSSNNNHSSSSSSFANNVAQEFATSAAGAAGESIGGAAAGEFVSGRVGFDIGSVLSMAGLFGGF
ncbi:hypothetical protein ACA910_002485 [Epithemia clementina (nom. ined.)]